MYLASILKKFMQEGSDGWLYMLHAIAAMGGALSGYYLATSSSVVLASPGTVLTR